MDDAVKRERRAVSMLAAAMSAAVGFGIGTVFVVLVWPLAAMRFIGSRALLTSGEELFVIAWFSFDWGVRGFGRAWNKYG